MSVVQSAARLRLASLALKYTLSVPKHHGGILLACSLAIACARGESRPASKDSPAGDAIPIDATLISTIPVRARPALRENSAAVMSVSQPGVLFTINDSGNEPVLFALDTAGNDRGAWVVRGARNDDWEAAALGPCGPATRGDDPARALDDRQEIPGATAHCLYIGDVGDNAATRPSRVIYRVPEPRAGASGYNGSLAAERVRFRYADGPHDVEALWVGSDGTTWLMTKRRLDAPDGTRRPALIFALDADAWQRPDSTATARLVDSIPVVPGSAPGRMITDAALSSDGKQLAVRTYIEVFTFDADPATGRVASGAPTSVCGITGLRQRQGEGVTWLGTSGWLLLTSEGHRSPMHIISCGPPLRPS